MRHLCLIPCLAILAGAPLAAAELIPGLVGEYYSFPDNLEDFPAIAADAKPVVRRADMVIAFETTDDAWPKTQLIDHFAVRWTGILRVPTAATYTLYLESDDGSRVAVDGKQVIDNGGSHGMEEKEGDVVLTAGDHQLAIDFFQGEGGKGCTLSWSAPDLDKTIVPGSALLHSAEVLPPPSAAEPLPAATDRQPGLRAEIFPVDGQDDTGRVPALSADIKPTVSRIDAQVDVSVGDQAWPGTTLTDHFYVRWTGIVRVPANGVYTFTTDSDDGSWLTIGGIDVVENSGTHAMQEVSGVVTLKAGDHPIRLDYRESEGDAGCRLLWTIPGGTSQVVPASALLHAAP